MVKEVNLKSLRQAGLSAVKEATEGLRLEGFIFLDMSSNSSDDEAFLRLQMVADEALAKARPFLQGQRSNGSKDPSILHGHLSHRYKDSLRLLTGNQFDMHSNCPSELSEPVSKLAVQMDTAAKDVTEALAQSLFYLESAQMVGDYFELPLLRKQEQPDDNDDDDSDSNNHASYGMLDIVCYHNDIDTLKTASPPSDKIIVSAHQDPGLFVLALPESSSGLELWDPITNRWVSPPSNKGVMWAGQAASTFMRPCLHRVVVKQYDIPRIACWHEVCTQGQICMPMIQRLESKNQELALNEGWMDGDNIVGTTKVLEHLHQAENHEYPKFQNKTNNDEGKNGNQVLGVPRSWLDMLFLAIPKDWQPSKNESKTKDGSTQEEPAGVELPDTVSLWSTNGVPASKNVAVLKPLKIYLRTKSKKEVEKVLAKQRDEEEATKNSEAEKKVYDNDGLGYTVTVETIYPKPGVPGPKVDELTLRVQVRKNRRPCWRWW